MLYCVSTTYDVSIGAIPETEGHFDSLSLPLLPAPHTLFNCNGSEAALSECTTETDTGQEEGECIRDDAGVVCQGKYILLNSVLFLPNQCTNS